MEKHFKRKKFLISGGSSGIGLAMAKLAVTYGADVWILARDVERLKKAQYEIEKLRVDERQCIGILPADVTQESSIQRVVDDLEHAGAIPDFLINSAGVAHPGMVAELDSDMYRWMMDVNFYGTVNLTRAVLKPMVARGSGHIVVISSGAGFLGINGYAAYSASKYAVRGFSDVLRAEAKSSGIDVSIAFPTDTDTPQLAYENIHKPELTSEIENLTGLRVATPDFMANKILHGVARRKYIILPGADSAALYWISSLCGSFTYTIVDVLLKIAAGRLRKRKNGSGH